MFRPRLKDPVDGGEGRWSAAYQSDSVQSNAYLSIFIPSSFNLSCGGTSSPFKVAVEQRSAVCATNSSTKLTRGESWELR